MSVVTTLKVWNWAYEGNGATKRYLLKSFCNHSILLNSRFSDSSQVRETQYTLMPRLSLRKLASVYNPGGNEHRQAIQANSYLNLMIKNHSRAVTTEHTCPLRFAEHSLNARFMNDSFFSPTEQPSE